jgi:Na+-transporting NADH:ubiquinone oxidoreductase subunit B
MMRGTWTPDTIAWVIVVALLPTATIAVLEQGAGAALRIGLSWTVVAAWQLLFALVRGQRLYPIGAVTAVAVTVLAPGELALWQLVLALTFGTVVGELIFGGWGRNFLGAAVVTLAFLFFSFPEVRTAPSAAGTTIAMACLPAAAGLSVAGILSWRIVVGALAGLLMVAALAGAGTGNLSMQGALAFGLVFLVGDPVTAACTTAGRWIFGAAAGALTGLFTWGAAGVDASQAIVFATLIASIFAPLIDHGVIAAKNAARSRRHG